MYSISLAASKLGMTNSMNRKLQVILTALAIIALTILPAGAAEGKDYTKVFIIPLTVTDAGAVVGDVTLQYGYGPNMGLQSGTFRGDVTDAKGMNLASFAIWDPRVSFGDSLVKKADGTVSKVTGVYEKKDKGDVTLVVPFSPASGSFFLYNGNGTKVASADLTTAIRRFCADNPNDPDCSTPFPLLLVGSGILVLVVFGGIAFFLLRKKGIAAGTENNG